MSEAPLTDAEIAEMETRRLSVEYLAGNDQSPYGVRMREVLADHARLLTELRRLRGREKVWEAEAQRAARSEAFRDTRHSGG